MNKKVVIIGAGGHAKVIADIITKSGDKVVGFLDDNKKIDTNIIGNYKVIGDFNNRFPMMINKDYKDCEFIIAIGDNERRNDIVNKTPGMKYYTAISPSAQIGIDVQIGEGTVIMPNVVINSSSKIGKHCIINTGAIVEHDNNIEDYVHISPNATLCGTVHIGKCTHIGAGSTIKNNITITDNCIIGAGAVVVKNIDESGTYVGIPANKK